jgi:hypothetical protein
VNIVNNRGIRWKHQADNFRGCNCKSICHCIFRRDQDEGLLQCDYCRNIQRGNYGNISTDIVNVVAVFHTAGNILIEPK